MRRRANAGGNMPLQKLDLPFGDNGFHADSEKREISATDTSERGGGGSTLGGSGRRGAALGVEPGRLDGDGRPEAPHSAMRVEALAPAPLTDGERKAFRMGALAAGAVYIDAIRCERCRERVSNLRIAIAAKSVECEAPGFWPQRGGR